MSKTILGTSVLVAVGVVAGIGALAMRQGPQEQEWTATFAVDSGELTSVGRYYHEVAPRVAMDRAEIVSVTESMSVPARDFTDVLKVEETTPLEPGIREYKYYAPGVGLLQDGPLKLVSFGRS